MPELPRSRWCSQLLHNYLGNYAKEREEQQKRAEEDVAEVYHLCWQWLDPRRAKIETLKWQCQTLWSYKGQFALSLAKKKSLIHKLTPRNIVVDTQLLSLYSDILMGIFLLYSFVFPCFLRDETFCSHFWTMATLLYAISMFIRWFDFIPQTVNVLNPRGYK